MPMNAYDWLTEYLHQAGAGHLGKNWQCPAHDDSFPSLSIGSRDDGAVLLFCHAGCSFEEIMKSLGLSTKLLFEPHSFNPKKLYQSNLIKPKFKPVKYPQTTGKNRRRESFHITYHQYTDLVRLERIKYESGEKICRWQVKEGKSWIYSNGGTLHLTELPLYNESEVIKGGYLGEVIVLCESESSVDAIFSKGIFATTWAGGASSPKIQRLQKVVANQKVLWIPDNDDAGLKCSKQIVKELKPVTYRWQELLGEPDEDARDLLKRGVLTLETVDSLFRER